MKKEYQDLTYSEICQVIQDAPRTWQGGILARAINSTVEKKFFTDIEAIKRFMNNVADSSTTTDPTI